MEMGESQGQQLLRSCLPHFSTSALNRLAVALKREADKSWYVSAEYSLRFSGYLLLVGEETHNKLYHALGLMAHGDALRRMNRNQEALPFLDAAGEEFLAVSDEVGWARTRFGHMGACLHLNRPSDALRDAQAARDIFLRHKKWRRVGQIDVNTAIVKYELGSYEEAAQYFDRAIEMYGLCKSPMVLYIARAQGNKALALTALGRFREALVLHRQARDSFMEAGEREAISVAREDMNIADIYEAQGRYSAASQLYLQCRASFREHEMIDAAFIAALKVSKCLIQLNLEHEAYPIALETVQYFQEITDQPEMLAQALMFQAMAAIKLEQLQEGTDLLYRASTLLETAGYLRLATVARFQRAQLYFHLGQTDMSACEATYVAEAFAAQEDLPHLAQAFLLQGAIAAVRNEGETARDLTHQALDIAQGQGALELLYRCNDFLGQLAEKNGDREQAEVFYERALQEIDEIQRRLVFDERSSFLSNKADIYQHAILMAWRQGLYDRAFLFVEKAKSRVVGDYLRDTTDIRIRIHEVISPDIVEALQKAREEQAYFSSIVYHTVDEVSLSDSAKLRVRAIPVELARSEMHTRERQIEQLLARASLHAYDDSSDSMHTHFDWFSEGVETLQQNLPPAALLLEYYVGGDDLYIFQVVQQAVSVQVVTGAIPKIERLLSLWRANLDLVGAAAHRGQQARLADGLIRNGLGLLQRFFDLLMRPVAPALQVYSHLVIVPYGMLHYIPFHCLHDGTRFLVEYAELSYLPASSMLDVCRRRGRRTGTALRTQRLTLTDSLVMGLSDNGRLHFAAHEADTVAELLNVRSYHDREATASLLQRQRGFAVVAEKTGATGSATGGTRAIDTSEHLHSPLIHIAAHGLFRLDSPNFSYIKLGDRQFSTIEAFNLDLTACSLLVLSACETGRSVIGGLDEVMGLGRGFLYAGAASLLPTLWKVDDASSAELMEIFYRVLLGGATKAAALASAQRIFLRRARSQPGSLLLHPYFWAAFYLIGDPGALM